MNTEGEQQRKTQNQTAKSNLGMDADPECDDINFANYKGIYAEEGDGTDQKFTCPVTGAHFEFNDVCRRLVKVIEKRKPHEMELYGPPEDTSLSVLSVSEELLAQAT